MVKGTDLAQVRAHQSLKTPTTQTLDSAWGLGFRSGVLGLNEPQKPKAVKGKDIMRNNTFQQNKGPSNPQPYMNLKCKTGECTSNLTYMNLKRKTGECTSNPT